MAVKTKTVEAMKAFVDLLARSNIGYDQWQRWSFYKNGKVIPNTEADCSSICGAIIHAAGWPIDLSGTFYTGNMIAKARAVGFQVIKFTSLSQLRPGDLVVNEIWHVEFVYGPNDWYSARVDEKGGITGGKAGNQTGKETGFVRPYIYSRGGWDWILRPPAPAASKPAPKPPAASAAPKPPTAKVKGYLKAMGLPQTAAGVKTYQERHGLHPDGDWGPITQGYYDWVLSLQRALNQWKAVQPKLRLDGDRGPVTKEAERRVQIPKLNQQYLGTTKKSLFKGLGIAPEPPKKG